MLLEVGRVSRAHGIRGDVLVVLVTTRDNRLAAGLRVTTASGRELTVKSARPHGERWIVSFDEVVDRTGAERLRGEPLLAEHEPGPDDELWVHEIIGALVETTEGERLGVVEAVEANPASDLLVIEGGPLVPLRFVVDHEPGRLVVELPEGLLEL